MKAIKLLNSNNIYHTSAKDKNMGIYDAEAEKYWQQVEYIQKQKRRKAKLIPALAFVFAFLSICIGKSW